MTTEALIEEIKRRQLMDEIASRRQPAQQSDAPPSTEVPEAAEVPQPKAGPYQVFTRLGKAMMPDDYYQTLTTGVSDAMSALAGDEFTSSGERREMNIPRRLVKATGGYAIPAAQEVLSDAAIKAGKAVLPESAEEYIGEKVGEIAQSKPVQWTQEQLGELKEKYPEGYELGYELLNIGGAVSPKMLSRFKLGAADKYSKKLSKAARQERRKQVKTMLDPDPKSAQGQYFVERGVVARQKYKPTQWENRMIDEVTDVPGVNPKKSFTENSGFVEAHVSKLNRELLDTIDNTQTLNTQYGDIIRSLDDAKSELFKGTTFVGDAATSADKMYDYVLERLNDVILPDGTVTPQNILALRRELDDWLKKTGTKDMFKGDAIYTANNQAAHSIRSTLNTLVDAATPDVDVSGDLKRMSDLLTARDRWFPHVSGEYNSTRAGRFMHNLERTTGVRHPTTPAAIHETWRNPVIGAVAGATALSISAAHQVGKLLRSGKMNVVQALDIATNASTSAADRAAILSIIAEMENPNG